MKPTVVWIAVITLAAKVIAQGPISSCTTTLTKVAQFNLDPTTTVYLSTETETSSVDCGGCVLAVATRNLGPGPVRKITATATDPVTTTTETACSATGY